MHTWGSGGDGLSGRVGAVPAAPGRGGAGRRPKHPEPTRVTGAPGARVRQRRRRSPASLPPVPRGPPGLGRPPPGSLPLPSPCLPPPGPPLAPGTWGPAGEWSRARASPYVTARGPPRPSRGSRVLLANVPNPGAASARPRFTRAPLAGADRRETPRARRAPRVRRSWLRAPRVPGRAERPAVPPAVSPGPAGLRRLSPALCNSPRLERGQRLGRRLWHGFMPVPMSPRARATCVALTPPPGSPGPAEGTEGRACSHLRSRRLLCPHLLGLSSAGVTTPASSCDITCQGVRGHRRRPLSRPCHREQGQRR